MAIRNRQFYTIFDNISADLNSGLDAVSGEAYGINCMDFRNAVISVATSNSANLTLTIKGALADAAEDVDFASAASRTNDWTNLQIVNLEDGVATDGDTGKVYSGTDGNFKFEVNVNAVDFLQFEVSSYVAGNINVNLTLTENS